jgi:hypothetical protein
MEALEDRTLLSSAFNAPQELDIPSGPTAVATGSFEGTKAPLDIVTADTNGTISVLLGNGDGTLQVPINIHIGGSFDSVAVGDFLGNGLQDIVAANTNGTVSVLLSNGDGTFKVEKPISVGATPTGVAVGDLLGNGKLGIVTANRNGSVTALLGNGDGTFGMPIKTTVVGASFSSLALGPFSKGSKLDAVVGTNTGVDTLLGNGDGTFKLTSTIQFVNQQRGLPPQTIPVSAVALGDFRNDGKLDIVANAESQLNILLGNGDGTFQSRVTLDGGPGPLSSFALGDFNGDGKLDIATSSGALSEYGPGPSLNFLAGKGDGTLQPTQNQAIGVAANALAVGDFTGSGKLDLAFATSNDVSAVLGKGDGTFALDAGIAVNAGLPSVITTGNFTNSGVPDIVTTGVAGGVAVLLNNGDGTFRQGPTLSVSGAPSALAVGAFTSDGHQDIVVGDESGDVSVFLGNGGGTFQSPLVFSVNTKSANFSIRGLEVGDFNQDGKLDLAVLALNLNSGAQASEVVVFLGKGNGTFTKGQTIQVGADAQGLAVGNFNGKLDLVTTSLLSNGNQDVKVLLGNGNGTFQAPIQILPGTRSTFVGVGNFNGDGHQDLVLVDYFDDTVSVLLGSGNGSFGNAITTSIPNNQGFLLSGPAVGDFFGGGKLDVAVTSGAGRVTILRGNGDGTFQAPINFIVGFHGQQPSALTAADFNGDGKLDVAATNTLADTVSVLLNTTTPPATNRVGTTTTLAADTTKAVFGQPVTLTATVTASKGTPMGSVTFFDGTTVLGVAAVDPNGQAVLRVPFGVGTQSLTASFAGINGFQASASGTVLETVNRDATAMSVSTETVDQIILLVTATVNPAPPGAGLPTGTVVLREGNTIVRTATLDSNGQVSFDVEGLKVGEHKFTLSYNGDNNFLASTLTFDVNIT